MNTDKTLIRVREILKDLNIKADEPMVLNFALVYATAQRDQIAEELKEMRGTHEPTI